MATHPDYPDSDLSRVRQRLLEGMIDFMQPDDEEDDDPEDWDCGYSQEDVHECATILDEYLAELDSPAVASPEDVRKAVEKVVLRLNALNERCDGGLIETDQREDLCELILVSARGAGLDTDEDITEQWREW